MSDRQRDPVCAQSGEHARPGFEPLLNGIADLERVRDFCLQLYHLAPVGYLTLSSDGLVVAANHTAGAMLGVPVERLRGEPLSAFVERGASELEAHLARVVSAGLREALDLRFTRPSGTRFHATMESVAILDAAGTSSHILATLIDVSEPKRLEGGLLEREATLQALLAVAPDAIVGVDEQGTIRCFGAAGERMFGVSAADVIGRHVGMLFEVPPLPIAAVDRGSADHVDGSAALAPHNDAALATVREARGRRADGTIFDAAVSVGRVAGASYAILVIRDVTAQREMERALAAARPLETAGRLALGVAHDTNNLLMGIVSAAEALEGGGGDLPTVRARVEELKRVALGAAATIRRLSALVGAPAEGVREDRIDAAIEGMGPLLAPMLGPSIELVMRLGAPGVVVPCDRGQIEQIILNLAVNARDAMPSGGTLAIETARVEGRAGPFVRLTVRDTGAGMDEHVRSRVLRRSFTTKETGTGVGLVTVRAILDQARGHAEVESELGRGTSFVIVLPEVRLEGPAARPARAGRGARTLLVVESDTLVRSTLTASFERAGHRVIEARDAREALEACQTREDCVDALVTDVALGGALGATELIEAVRRLYPNVAVVLTSGHPILVRRGRLDANVFLLQRPCSEDDLAEVLEEALGSPAPERAPVEAASPCSVLVVEDDSLSRRMLGQLLRKRGYAVTLASTIAEALAHHRRGPPCPDVVVADGRLPDGDVGDLVRSLRGESADPPVVVVSGLSEREDPQIASVLGQPRTAFVRKPAGIDEIVRRIEELARPLALS